MCRIFGAVGPRPFSVRHELLSAQNPLIKQSESHDSGWGLAVYGDPDGDSPTVERFPLAAHLDPRFESATAQTGQIFNVHVRRATLGGLSEANTHPFADGRYTYAHNGTIANFRALAGPQIPAARGETDSEHFFRRLIHDLDPADIVGSLRSTIALTVELSVFSGLNFLFSDGRRLYAYRFGVFDLFWRSDRRRLMVASEKIDHQPWHEVEQDVLLTLDPQVVGHPAQQRLLGQHAAARARIERLELPEHVRGEERGRIAAERAAAAQGD